MAALQKKKKGKKRKSSIRIDTPNALPAVQLNNIMGSEQGEGGEEKQGQEQGGGQDGGTWAVLG